LRRVFVLLSFADGSSWVHFGLTKALLCLILRHFLKVTYHKTTVIPSSRVVDSLGSGVEATEVTDQIPLEELLGNKGYIAPVWLSNDAMLVRSHLGETALGLPGRLG
jgi:hypothetical protein